MKNLWIDVEDASLTKTGAGPVSSATRWESIRRLDRAGTFRTSLPATDNRSALIAHKKILRCYGIVNEAVVEIGHGIVDRIDADLGNDGQALLSVEGDDLLRELVYRSVGALSINGANGPQLIMALAPAGWSLDTLNGYDTTAVSIQHTFEGGSVLAALSWLAQTTGEHFRLGAGRKVVWLRNLTPSSGIRAVQGGNPVSLEGNEKVCLIVDLQEERDTYELASRIKPYGAGEGSERLTLSGASWSPPSGYSINTGSNYIQRDDAYTQFGLIEREVQFKDIDNANTLAQAAYAWLARNSYEFKSYRLRVAKLDTTLHPGQTIRVEWRKYIDTGSGIFEAVNINTDLVVLEVQTVCDGQGLRTSELVVATVDRWPVDEAGVILEGLGQAQAAFTYAQPVESGSDPNALLRDGSRSLLGNMAVADLVTIDGVDLSAHVLNAAAHHNPVTLGAGGLTAKLGLANQVLTLAAINHSDLSNITANQHHNQVHSIIGPDHTVAGSAWDVIGLTGTNTLGILGSSSNPGAAEKLLRTDASGKLTLDLLDLAELQVDFVDSHLIPKLTDTYDLGSSTKLWRKGWLSELEALLFVENTITLLGGWFWVPKDAGTLPVDVNNSQTTIDFGKAMTPNDFVVFRSSLQVEYMTVGSLVSGTTYNVTRNLDGSGANSWVAGQPFAVLGQSGAGRIELNAYDTPRVQLIKQGATYNAQTELIRIGDLNGNWGYAAQKWGLAIGDYASGKPNITIDEDGVLRFRLFTTEVMRFEGGNADITGKLRLTGVSAALAVGSTPPTGQATGTGLWMDQTGLYGTNGSAATLRLKPNDIFFFRNSSINKYVEIDGDVKLGQVSLGAGTYSAFNLNDNVRLRNTPAVGGSGEAYSALLLHGYGSAGYHDFRIRGTSGTGGTTETGPYLRLFANRSIGTPSWQGTLDGFTIQGTSTINITGDITATGNIRADTRFKRGGLDVYPFLQLTHTYVEVFNQACTDNTDYTIDFTTWVPDSAPLVVVRFLLSSASAGVSGGMREYGQTAFSSEQLVVRGQVANQYNEVQGICSKDGSGRVQVRCSGANATMIVRLIGYFT